MKCGVHKGLTEGLFRNFEISELHIGDPNWTTSDGSVTTNKSILG